VFADDIRRVVGAGMLASIANYGEDSLALMMLSMPEFLHFGDVRIRRFVHEFINYEEYLDADDADLEADSPESASDTPRRSRANA